MALSMSSDTSSILEIPNTISDVFMEDRISEYNYMDKVAIWKNSQHKNAANFAPTVLLIHPNRSWKIIAEQSFISQLSSKTTIIPFEEYGQYWKDRVATDFDFNTTIDSLLTIKVNLSENQLNKKISFVIKNGQKINKINVIDANNVQIPFSETEIRENEKLIYFTDSKFSYSDFQYDEKNIIKNLQVYPIPSNDIVNFKFSLINDAHISLVIYDELGNSVEEVVYADFELGNHTIKSNKKFAKGMYFYSIKFDNEELRGKLIIK
jgi:hypothetical protein